MIWFLLALHVMACVVAGGLGDRWGRSVFAVAAIPSVVTAAWAVTRLGDTDVVAADIVWVEGLDLSLTFAVGPLAALLTLIVSGIGALVFVYAAGYFTADAGGLGRFAATLTAFSAAMVGLVWADSVWTLFIFWELTSVTSFLLVGFKTTSSSARLAARRALLITVAGGLVLLAAFVLLVDAAGTARLSQMGPVDGATASVAAVLVLVAAATKSAQVPFHVWLPGAMAAPTPVSAYLHSATMVKAGVLLVALTAPILGSLDVWTPLGLGFGLASMIWGAVVALRQVDAKLILAWGTISQLGLLIALLSVGTGKATFAAASLLVAHAVFKAALFMVVGEIDVRTGTRNIEELSGLWRSMPFATVVAVVSGASMAGLPPLMGFPAKEAAIEGVLGLKGFEAWFVGGAVIGGSVLTVAYTVRLLIGLFASAPSAIPTSVAPARGALTLASGVLGALSLFGFVFLGTVTDIVRPAATSINGGADAYSLLRWPGLTTAFLVSFAIVVGGASFGAWLALRHGVAPAPRGAVAVDAAIDGVLVAARWTTGRVQHGSLPVYLVAMAATAGLATIPFAFTIDTDELTAWDNPVQAMLAVLVVAAALTTSVLGSRLGAALGLGVVGLGVAGLFVVHGAPDLALTQLLVETVVVVGFVIGLGHLARQFPRTGQRRGVRITVAVIVGGGITIGLLAAASDRVAAPPVEAIVAEAVDEGGGNNVVNVILTDIRALDTLGEIVVLAVVAIGVLALARPKGAILTRTADADATEGAS